jgi:hypothetical protein
MGAWSEPFFETTANSTVRRSLQTGWRTESLMAELRSAGEAEAGTAGVQPVKEYLAETLSNE